MAKNQLKPIPARDPTKPVRLAESYAAGEVDMCAIHAYNAVDAERKEQFHRDGSRFLHSVGAYLQLFAGFTQMSCHSNKGGIAVGGEVEATYVHPERGGHLRVTIASESFWEGSPRDDRLVIRAWWSEQGGDRVQDGRQSMLSSEQGPTYKKKSGRGRGIALAAYRHTIPAGGRSSRLNPNYDSEVTARCLLLVLSVDHAAEYWEWLPDGTRIAAEQEEAERERWREAREHARARRGQWEPMAAVQWADDFRLRDDYLAAMSSRLLFASSNMPGASVHGLEQPRMSRGGEESFLQRDFTRDARAFLRALGSCLLEFGYCEMRLVEPERFMLVFAEYRKAEQEEVLRVKLGSVVNTDVAQRHDHLVIAAFKVPVVGAGGGDGEQCIELSVPIKLSAAAYARQLITALDPREVNREAASPTGGGPPARKGRRHKAKKSSAQGSELVRTSLF